MSDAKLNFSLVSPARELFHGEVDHVIAPGSEGEFGVLPNHAPFMSTLRSGRIRIIDGNEVHRYFVHGGFADVTPEGLTILAEEAIRLEDLDVPAPHGLSVIAPGLHDDPSRVMLRRIIMCHGFFFFPWGSWRGHSSSLWE